MAKTVVMKKGDRFADIYDSPETIAQARKDGYHTASETEIALRFPKKSGEKAGNKTGGKKTDELLPDSPADGKPEASEQAKTE